jgi:hypothetical protein
MAAAGVPMRTVQEWMGHADFKTTLICADYSPSEHEAEWVERAFAPETGMPGSVSRDPKSLLRADRPPFWATRRSTMPHFERL